MVRNLPPSCGSRRNAGPWQPPCHAAIIATSRASSPASVVAPRRQRGGATPAGTSREAAVLLLAHSAAEARHPSEGRGRRIGSPDGIRKVLRSCPASRRVGGRSSGSGIFSDFHQDLPGGLVHDWPLAGQAGTGVVSP